VRVDGCVNGWLLGTRNDPDQIWLIEWVALMQTVAQVLGAIWVVALIVALSRSSSIRLA
jgi:hypothetical protein